MATPVGPGNQTVAFIRSLVRELCACPAEQQLATSYIDETLNNFYASDFPYGIKLDQMRSVYKFFTTPYQSYYPLDVNFNQGVRAPVYVDGVQATFYKDRQDFFALWPRWPTFFNNFGQSSAFGGISNITNFNPGAVTTTSAHGLSTGNQVYITGVTGMTQVNGQTFTITVTGASSFTLGVDTTAFGVYTGGGTYYLLPVNFSFTTPGPILQGEVTIGGSDINGSPFAICDDTLGNLQLQTANPIVSVPSTPPTPPNLAFPGMYNLNTQNPGLLTPSNVGSVNYVTGVMSFNLPLPLQSGTTLQVRVSQYATGRPYSLLFWNNYFIIRPTPKHVHKVEVETYLTPVQFMQSTDLPILSQWAQYLGYGVACEILRRRQDTGGLANLMEGFKRQEALALERQGTEEINQRNATLFSSTTPNQGWNNGLFSGWNY